MALPTYGGYPADDPRNNVGRGILNKLATQAVNAANAYSTEGATPITSIDTERNIIAERPFIDRSGTTPKSQVVAAFGDRLRNLLQPGDAAYNYDTAPTPPTLPVVQSRATPNVVLNSGAPAAVSVAQRRGVRRNVTLGGTKRNTNLFNVQPDAEPMGPAQPAEAPMTAQDSYGESDGNRIYAPTVTDADKVANDAYYARQQKVTTDYEAAKSAHDNAIRDDSLDPGTQRAWARDTNAANMFRTVGAKGLAALGAYDTAQLAPAAAQLKAAGDLDVQRSKGVSDINVANIKGLSELEGHRITAGGVVGAADIRGRHDTNIQKLKGASDLEVANTKGMYDNEGNRITGRARIAAANAGKDNSLIKDIATLAPLDPQAVSVATNNVDALRAGGVGRPYTVPDEKGKPQTMWGITTPTQDAALQTDLANLGLLKERRDKTKLNPLNWNMFSGNDDKYLNEASGVRRKLSSITRTGAITK